MNGPRQFGFGRFVFRLPERVLEIDGHVVRLGSRATDLLHTLLVHRGELVGNRALQQAVWPEIAVDESALRVHLSSLRRALAAEDPSTLYIANEPGRGYRIACSVEEISPHPQTLAFRTGLPPLPALLNSVLGRDEAITQLQALLASHRLLSILGPGGIGKTTIAVALATRVRAQGTRVNFVDFSSVDAPHLVGSAVALTFGVGVTTEDPVPSLAISLGDEEALLVLDNCEHLADPIAQVATRLLHAVPRLRLLVTSREPLRSAGEYVYRLAPLKIPPEGTDYAAVAQFDSVQLLAERARAVSGTFRVHCNNAHAVCEICRRLDGLPLALEFAAARLDIMDAATLLRRLEDRVASLVSLSRTVAPRHRTLRATIDWSYDLLEPGERSLLHRLSIFKSSFDLADVLGVCSTMAHDDEIIDRLGELSAKSLLVTDRGNDQVRYRLLDTIRHYAAEKLAASGEADLALQLHAQHCLSVLSAYTGSEKGEGQRAPLRGYAHRLDDVRAAINWALRHDLSLAICLVLAAAPLWFALSLTEECAREAERVLAAIAAAGRPASSQQVQLLCIFGRASYHSHWPPAQSASAYARALELARTVGDSLLELQSLWGLWADHTLRGDYADSLAQARAFDATAIESGADAPHRAVGQLMTAFADHLVGAQGSAQARVDGIATEQTRRPDLASRNRIYGVSMPEAIRARTLWVRGFADQALALTRSCAERLAEEAHDLTICTNFAVAFVPVPLWCGDRALACHMFNLLDRHSRRHGNQHWTTWATGFRMALHGEGNAPSEETWLQLDTGATIGRCDALRRVIAEGRHQQESWCQAELLRRWALIEPSLSLGARIDTLMRALEIARHNGELAWELRIAMDLARLDDLAGARSRLAAVLSRFSEGFATRDLRDAIVLRDRTILT